MKKFIAILSALVILLAMAIVYTTPEEAYSGEEEPMLEYSYEEPAEDIEVVTDWVNYGTIEEDNEVDFDSDYDYYCWLVGYAAERSNVSPELAIAISRLETANFTSKAFQNFNFGGLSQNEKPMSFSSEVEGLERYINLLVWYQDNGMDTPEKMANTYCPVNASEWAKEVRTIMGEVNYESYQ